MGGASPSFATAARRRVRRLERRRRRGDRAPPTGSSAEVVAPSGSRRSTPTSTSTTSRAGRRSSSSTASPVRSHWPANDCYAVVVRRPRPRRAARHRAQRALEVVLQRGDDRRRRDRLRDGRHPRRAARRRAAHPAGCASPAPPTDPELVDALGLARSRYEGPTGIVGVLHDACRATGLQSVSLWAPVPHYIATPPNPPATRALLERFGTLAGLTLDLEGLDQLVDLWRAQVDHAIARQRRGAASYVRELEGRSRRRRRRRARHRARRAPGDGDSCRTATSSSTRSSSSSASRTGLVNRVLELASRALAVRRRSARGARRSSASSPACSSSASRSASSSTT